MHYYKSLKNVEILHVPTELLLVDHDNILNVDSRTQGLLIVFIILVCNRMSLIYVSELSFELFHSIPYSMTIAFIILQIIIDYLSVMFDIDYCKCMLL